MSTITTANRNYVFPLKDEDLESSNNLLRITTESIDSDVHQLFTEKANTSDTDTTTEIDTKISTAVSDYDTALDIYGTYVNGDVNTDGVEKTKLVLPVVNAGPGWFSRVNVNDKGQVIGTDVAVKSNISDFTETDYVHLAGTETITGDKTFTGIVNLPSSTTIDPTTMFDDTSTVSTTKGWTTSKIVSELGAYVPLTAYTDALVLSKVQAASLVNGTETLASFGIIDAYTQTETDALVWDWSDITTGLPTTISGFGITDAYTQTETDALLLPANGTSISRPAVTDIGSFYFDTDLTKPIWWDGINWVDATGTIV